MGLAHGTQGTAARPRGWVRSATTSRVGGIAAVRDFTCKPVSPRHQVWDHRAAMDECPGRGDPLLVSMGWRAFACGPERLKRTNWSVRLGVPQPSPTRARNGRAGPVAERWAPKELAPLGAHSDGGGPAARVRSAPARRHEAGVEPASADRAGALRARGANPIRIRRTAGGRERPPPGLGPTRAQRPEG